MVFSSRQMNPEVRIIDHQVLTNTQNVAWSFKLPHESLLEDVFRLECSPAFRDTHFHAVSYTDPDGKEQRMYRLTRDGFILLTHRFQGEQHDLLKHAYVEAFERMENVLLQADTFKNPFLDMTELDLMKLQASIEADRRILNRAGYSH